MNEMINLKELLLLFSTGFWIIILACFITPTDGLTCYDCVHVYGDDNETECLDPIRNNVSTQLCTGPKNTCLFGTLEGDYLVNNTHEIVHAVFRACWTYIVPGIPSNSTKVCEPISPPVQEVRAGETNDVTMLNKKILQSPKASREVIYHTYISCFCNSGDNCNDDIYRYNTTPTDTNTTVATVTTSIPAPGSASQIQPRYLPNGMLLALATVITCLACAS